MQLIIGLGNPGEKYSHNRHNVGYVFVDNLLKRNLPKSLIVKKTNIFMNDSGLAVKELVKKYRLKLENLYIVHDDLDIKLGEFKIQKGIGPKLHNVITSIDGELDEKDYWRVRIGVDNRDELQIKGEDYVLQDFTGEEKKVLEKVIENAINKLLFLINHG